MFNFFSKLTNNYGFEIILFNWIRELGDGISFFEFIINWNKFESDHTPSFEFTIIILNLSIIDFVIFYLHHRD